MIDITVRSSSSSHFCTSVYFQLSMHQTLNSDPIATLCGRSVLQRDLVAWSLWCPLRTDTPRERHSVCLHIVVAGEPQDCLASAKMGNVILHSVNAHTERTFCYLTKCEPDMFLYISLQIGCVSLAWPRQMNGLSFERMACSREEPTSSNALHFNCLSVQKKG
jgi:hypothetical protein